MTRDTNPNAQSIGTSDWMVLGYKKEIISERIKKGLTSLEDCVVKDIDIENGTVVYSHYFTTYNCSIWYRGFTIFINYMGDDIAKISLHTGQIL